MASLKNGSVRLGLRTNLETLERLIIARRDVNGSVTRTWEGSEFMNVQVTAEGSKATWQDSDPVGWPRTYALYYRSHEGDILLDDATVEFPDLASVSLAAHPNPFNPRIEISYQLPVAGRLRLDVVDVRGRVVRTLVSGEVAAGDGRVVWLGDDVRGRTVASGVYHVVAQTDHGTVKQQITLVR
jgi:hypothetical protein